MLIIPSVDAKVYEESLRTYLTKIKARIDHLTISRIKLLKGDDWLSAAREEAMIEAYRDVFDSLSLLSFEVIPGDLRTAALLRAFSQNPNRALA